MFGLGKSKAVVGLDIGSSAIKAVELKPGGKGGEYHLVNLGMEPLPPEAIVDGAIMDSGAVIDAIQRLFSANKIKTNDVACSVPSRTAMPLSEVASAALAVCPWNTRTDDAGAAVVSGNVGDNGPLLPLQAADTRRRHTPHRAHRAHKAVRRTSTPVVRTRACRPATDGTARDVFRSKD